ncbi:hypothetical protein M406DRAFT_102436 [Cryphonectria parasitica EP155]|uniref:Gpi-anchored protein n=1 Tax=Cryphonectria parasitica (strain ATCC 38755 / EP155) TaxID=660469 RepID=A0A9P4Y2G6_CRYP1|nr:uncharacterized protein M406DRAFT_102436 [Cryphonectria parasitica EP155]KAF3765263.1 hypothetical protein M406DRAFT_102436 [Cryphonectria parasitica EP155]
MRRRHLLSAPLLGITLLLPSSSSILASAEPQPFHAAQTPTPARRYHAAAPVEALFARATDGCIAGTYSCASEGSAFSGICCASGQACTLDASSAPACCPSGDVCTGTAPSSFAPPTTASASYVQNGYFSFPYVATSFSNAAACSSAVSACSRNYAACTADLEGSGGGGGGGVTIVVGGSTTVGGSAAATYATATATSICSSLSSVACFGIQDSYCTAGATAGFSVGSANAAARPTGLPCVGVVAGVAAGVGFGMVGL